LANVDSLAVILRKVDDAMRAQKVYANNAGLANLLFDAMTVVQESKEGMARIHRIARDLHSFSRVDDDANSLSDVNAAVDSALTMLRSELRYRATVERSLRATKVVRASAARLGQVFLNLLLNAAHALADLHPRRNRLYVRSRDEGESVIIEIEDNGPGIPPEIMPRIFESFFTTKPPDLGTGLGLPISLDIVRRAGGDLSAESEPGRGALFRVRYGGELDGAYRRHQHTDEQTCRHRFNPHFWHWKQPRGTHLRRSRGEVQRQSEGFDGR